MKLKEKSRKESVREKSEPKKLPPVVIMIVSLIFGYLSAGTHLGSGAPLCTALTAVTPLYGGAAVFVGAMVRFMTGSMNKYITEVISMPAVIFARGTVTMIIGRKLSEKGSMALAFGGYVISGIIAAFSCEITPALIAAIIFRGAISGFAAYYFSKASGSIKSGFGITPENTVPYVASYSAVVCMLCDVSFGSVNTGRICGLLCTALAAYRYGIAGGGAIGAVSAFAYSAVCPNMSATSAIAVCSGLAMGLVSKRGRLFASGVFLGTMLVGSLVNGMPADSVKLITDGAIASAMFFAVPDRFFRKALSGKAYTASAALKSCGNRLKFASSALADVKSGFSKAAEIFDRRERGIDIASEVCGKVCTLCRSSAFCGESEEHRISSYLVPAEKILEKKGYVTENDLHKGIECCPQKNMIAEEFNNLYRLSQLERRSGNITDCMKDITLEQLSGTEDMLNFFSRSVGSFPYFDEKLSEYICEALEEYEVKSPSAAVSSDEDGRVYVECFYEGLLSARLEDITDRFSEICDRDFGIPEVISMNGTTRLCFCELTVFEVETGRASVNGREDTSGDSDATFRDGLGNVYVLISDGMGSGVRAAVESCMAISMMSRAIRAGLGVNAAVRLVNLLLLTKSADESFATIDMMKLNLFSGKAEIIKLGAAQTFIRTGGSVKTVESWSTPVGIVSSVEISKRNFRLSDGDEIVMITDGISEECFPRVRELIMSVGVTAQDCAERIIGIAESVCGGEISHKDDKTVYVVKLHKI